VIIDETNNKIGFLLYIKGTTLAIDVQIPHGCYKIKDLNNCIKNAVGKYEQEYDNGNSKVIFNLTLADTPMKCRICCDVL
jgi:hypothetical protein